MRIFPETYAVGAQFGVVLVPVRDDANSTVEVATFRSDVGYSDGRHPDQVRFSKSAQEDVERRDFTINGLLFDPVKNEFLDFVGGRKDLEAGIIRTIGRAELRFTEDKLRMLRAVRFAARFGYTIEAGNLCRDSETCGGIDQVSRERVRDELTKMLTEGHARRAFLLLDETGLLQEVLPEISAMKGVQQPAGIPSRRRCFRAHAVAARKFAASVSADACLGSAVARCRQAAYVSRRSGSHSLR